jgi:Methyltransferase domain
MSDASDVTPSSIYLDGEYGNKNPSWHVEDSPWKAKRTIEALAFLPHTPRTICEVGCGAGEILRQLDVHFAAKQPVELVGYDVSPRAIALARERESQRLSFVLGDIGSDERHFDLLLVIDVVEHIEDHFAFLRRIRMKADYFVFHIPLELNCESLLRNFLIDTRNLYGHVHQFTRDTALATLRDCGYTVLHDFYTPGYECMPDSARTRITRAVRRMIFAMHPAFSAKLISGCSLMAVARA